ncbi:MAG TPA: PAS domain-containing sensor histidine kinase [Rhizomicrobium sp.]|jgi:two-component system nitrogen regulation sensor histidine kinase NtrY
MATTEAIDGPKPAGVLRAFRAISPPSLLALGVGVLAAISGTATYALVTGALSYRLTSQDQIALIAINLLLVVTLGGLIVWRLVRLSRERQAGRAGARLHVRLVGIFGVIAVVPVIFVAVFAVITLNLGIEQWFAPRVKTAIDNSIKVAQLYEQDYENVMKTDAFAIAQGIQTDPQLFGENRKVNVDELFIKLGVLTKDRGLQAAYIFDSHGRLLGTSKLRKMPDTKAPNSASIAQASDGTTAVLDANSQLGLIRVLVRLSALNDAYLLLVRKVDPTIFGYFQRASNTALEYQRMDADRAKVMVLFAELYGIGSLLILLVAVWLGLVAANRLVRPISQLVGAAERVSEGDLSAQVNVEANAAELAILGRAFNRMTSQLHAQRQDLVNASHQIDMRRRFTEAVLAGVSAGVMGLDGEGRITIVNRAAARLLNAAPDEVEGEHYMQAIPELAGLIRKAMQEPVGRAMGEATVKRADKVRLLSVQVSGEPGAGEEGYIVTFDDITDLASAQRTAAWAEVARRIAHEIKNPLTPIQLSAERLKRKYAKEIETDPEVFQQCTDTIIRQVGDIGRMVDEFSSFARMPQPQMRREIAQELLQHAVFLQKVAHPAIAFTTRVPEAPVYVQCDGRLITQALTNVIKNATESIGARQTDGDSSQGRISIAVEPGEDRIAFRICDNGIGLPREQRHRLTEPYVTTRAKGTGLGLAIVRKILEDHGGEISLSDLGDGESGAEVKLTLPLRRKTSRETTKGGIGDEQARIADGA